VPLRKVSGLVCFLCIFGGFGFGWWVPCSSFSRGRVLFLSRLLVWVFSLSIDVGWVLSFLFSILISCFSANPNCLYY